MHSAKLTAEEILAAEKASEDRRRSRNQGFAKMHERDQAVQLLSNGATMLWHVNKEDNKVLGGFTNDAGEFIEVITYPPEIPEDSFGLVLACTHCKTKRKYIFNLDEFRKWIRWA